MSTINVRFSLLLRAVLFCTLWVGTAVGARASHMLGAELTYEYTGTTSNPYQYHVTARLYHDNSGMVQPENQLTLTCGKNECAATLPGSFSATLLRTGTQPMPTSCGSGVAYQITTLAGTVQLPPAQWTLSINCENRAFNLGNISQSGNYSLYVKATLDNAISARVVNSSPKFTSSRLIQLLGPQPQRFSANAFDADGDSLAYQILQPQAALDPALPCGTPTPGMPAPHFQLNAATGELLTRSIPLQLGNYALTAQVSEYRRISGTWQQIGSVMRDVTYYVQSSTNLVPAFTRVATTQTPTGQLLGQTIRVSPGQTTSLVLTATDPDAGQTLAFSSDLAATVPGATLQDQGNGQSLLTWQVPATLPLGRYAFSVGVFDSACPLRGGEVLTLSFLMTRDVLATQPNQPMAQAPFPMPFREEVRFQFTGVGSQTIIIVDELGRTVQKLTTAADGRAVWRPTATLPAGLYFARNLDNTQVARLAYAGH